MPTGDDIFVIRRTLTEEEIAAESPENTLEERLTSDGKQDKALSGFFKRALVLNVA